MNSVAIVGLGNIGFRHLQAIAQLPDLENIYVIDPDSKINNKLNDINAAAKIHKFESLSEFINSKPALNLLISAVPTDIQFEIMPQILTMQSEVFLFEKPFAQSKSKYDAILALLNKNHSQTYINYQRNMWAGYRRIRDELSLNKDQKIHLEVYGNNWGLGCNAIHFIEAFRMITDAQSISAISAQMEVSRIEHKRGKQYEEFIGTISFRSELGHSLQVTSGNFSDASGNVFLTVFQEGLPRFFVDDEAGEITDLLTNEKTKHLQSFVSRTTFEFAKAIQVGQQANMLPTVDQARISHFAFYDALEMALKRNEFLIT